MKLRTLGRTGQRVSEIGFGAWAIGGTWGEVSMEDAKAALNAALDAGITFIDTADVYGDGRSEKIIAEVLNQRGGERPFVATKLGRRLSPHVAEGYNAENLNAFIDRSRENLQTDTLDLVQLHCPPTEVYYNPDVFAVMDEMVAAGKIRHYGVSVEKVEEGLKALEFPNVSSIQLIYNIFRQRPAELLLREAKRRDVAIIARVPLASGLLTGKMRADSVFAADDHRTFNRNGEAFDKGETFSGVPYEVALEAVEEIRRFVTGDTTMAMFALRWILMNEDVSVVIPGAKNREQAEANARASDVDALSADTMAALKQIYQEKIAPHVHQRW
ncbi:aldo/keto reductase [Pantoea agglomerans]|jgi:aryl-alcohol dehydrogenase-like predicted oxidoreductase|uniref:Aryl-alcohol dehydrogenase-like predicted oxidoreductase n=1 Tax=[Curtobacterium] plantarum TaxID=221276 RepID=A0ABT9TEV0_9GAMM|nr:MULTISPECIES: aldo/keto reductase [Pantoea]MDF9908383.1 aryl-alcohol dehydrogenase-like predicted oxidoreductase [Pantoea brenneri]ERM10625.1 aldo/keto reductase [Pantoea agglomerans Tx10]KAF6630042.1 aldo/keto reductase [Pantoea sp. EKM10T]KAF6679295.1 aldo/keto reductase [Pantoea sp. EKM20T]KDA94360.1 aldo/keto reductase [Pantoea agglomerans Eh318]